MNIEIALRMALVYFIVDHWSQSDCNVLPVKVKVRLQKLRGVTLLCTWETGWERPRAHAYINRRLAV